jgi:hypothetical protein
MVDHHPVEEGRLAESARVLLNACLAARRDDPAQDPTGRVETEILE